MNTLDIIISALNRKHLRLAYNQAQDNFNSKGGIQ